MKFRSFRIRVAILSVLCSSLVLLVTALAVGNIMWRTELRRADRFISTFVRDNVDHGFHPLPGPPEEDQRPPDREAGEPPDQRLPWQRPSWQRPPEPKGKNPEPAQPEPVYQFKDLASGRVIQSDNWSAVLAGRHFNVGVGDEVSISTVAAGGKLWRVGVGGNSGRSMILGLDLEPAITVLKQVASAFLLSIPVALLLIALGAVFIAHRALRPVHDLTQLAERITARGLSERIESHVKAAEFKKLIQVFNEMMDRLERSFLQANRFSADAAHELRTPITVLQGHMERMLQRAEPGSPAQQELGDMVDELHRIKSILERLLLLARMDAGQFQLCLSPLNLSELVQSITEDIQAVAPEIAVETRIEPGITVEADASLLETAIQNLGSNAVKYNLEKDGWIKVELARQKEAVILAVANTGPVIPATEREKIFERFYRADKSRSRETDGLGLGLSLAREIVQAHHGALRLVENSTAANCFEISLPVHHAE